MYMLNVTIAKTNLAQRVIPEAVTPDSMHPVQSMIPQNNGSNVMYLGDDKVSPTTGLVFQASASAGSLQNVLAYGSVLEDFYVYGTQGDVMNIMVFP